MSGGFTPCRHLRPSSHSAKTRTAGIYLFSVVMMMVMMMEKTEKRNRDEEALSGLIRHAWDTVDLFYPPAHTGDYIIIVPIPTSQPPTTSLHVNLQ